MPVRHLRLVVEEANVPEPYKKSILHVSGIKIAKMRILGPLLCFKYIFQKALFSMTAFEN